MPVVEFYTNLKRADLPENFHLQISKLIADTLNKPEKVGEILILI